jgi:SecD/SecF fusion protein
MSNVKKFLAGKVLLILILAGVLGVVDSMTELKLGLDLKGGTQLDYMIDLSNVTEADQPQIVEGVKEVIRRRVDGLGVSEPNIYTSNIADEHHIIVELAGISDIDEAKSTVGKTIQLEFHEENNEENSEEKMAWAETTAQNFYSSLAAGEGFEELAALAEEEGGEDVLVIQEELQAVENFSENVQTAISGKTTGSIIAPTEIDEGYIVTGDGMIQESKGIAVIQITDKTSEETEQVVETTVSARHILIAYDGAERSDATRGQEDAFSLAEELKDRITDGESLETLAGEFSDDSGSGAQGGDLGEFGAGVMTEDFEAAAFALEPGGLSEVIETEFGYHIIEVYEKQGGYSETVTMEKVALNKIVFSTLPDAWQDESLLTGEHFQHADVQFNDAYQPYVSITFTNEGADLFAELTGNNVGKRIAIFVGGTLVSAPTVNEKINGGNAQISGNFTLDEAQELARDLNTGAIPAPVELVGQYTISATLGAQALDQSLFAGLVGLLILALYMILYYRLPGLIATVALAVYSAILIFCIKIAFPTAIALLLGVAIFAYLIHVILKNNDSGGEKFISFILACVVLFFAAFVLSSKITLTLAGIAGVILSIGMAVDANVLIFERTKEELGEGKPLYDSIENGFKRAWDSIRDSNFSSLITCAILFYFGSSIIRGFALNLALGILLSMLSAIMLTRTMLLFAESTSLSKKLWLFGKPRVLGENLLQIIKNTKIWATISLTLLILSIIATAMFGLNLGLDFTGGTLLEVQLGSTDVTAETLTNDIFEIEAATEGDFGSPQVVATSGTIDSDGEPVETFIIRLKHVTEGQHDALLAKFTENYMSAEEIRFTTVGPTIGSTLKQKALIALAITLVMIVIYIAFAFRKIPREVSPWRFGMCAIAALVHDILIVLGVFVTLGHFMGVEIDALFITALLTIMGFSVHDTIVVFDRIRENLHFRKTGETLAETSNKALNQTMARSINTSISTLITILALLFLGADSIRMFVLALAIGIVAGTYSSIFVASPLLVWWNERQKR